MRKKIIIYGILSGVLTSAIVALNVYVMHIMILWVVAYVALPAAVIIGIASRERKVTAFLVSSTTYLFVQGIIVGLFELPIYRYWITNTTPAGSTYSRYQLDAFYPLFGFIFIIILLFAAGFIFWVLHQSTKKENTFGYRMHTDPSEKFLTKEKVGMHPLY